MNYRIDIPWNRYALIAELAKRLDSVNSQFGKTALQKHIYLLQEIYGIDCGYDFQLYSYGPFDSQLLGDLDLVEHWECVSVSRVNETLGGYRIRPADKVESIREKAADFLNDSKTKKALDDLVSNYGAMTAKNLELRATTVYVERNLRNKRESPSRKRVCQLVGQIKPKFTEAEIEEAVTELNKRKHIQLAA